MSTKIKKVLNAIIYIGQEIIYFIISYNNSKRNGDDRYGRK